MFKRLLMLGLASLGLMIAAGCASTPGTDATSTTPAVLPGPWPPPSTEQHPRVLIETSLGDITLQLDHAAAPISVDNFVGYVRSGRYDNTVFHRVVPGFVIQGGGYDSQLQDHPRHAQIKLEANNGLSNLRGTVAMARDEAPDTADCEFYINLVDNLKLNPHPENPENPARKWGYAVFGSVVSGMDVVDRIAAVPTHTAPNGMADAPVETVLIRKVTLLPPGS